MTADQLTALLATLPRQAEIHAAQCRDTSARIELTLQAPEK